MLNSSKNGYHDINLPVFTVKKEEPNAFVNNNYEQEPAELKKNEVQLIKADTWSRGEKGFSFNEWCFLIGTLKFLINTTRTRVTGKLFVRTDDGVIEDLGHTVEGFANRDGCFQLKVRLFYGKHYYNLLEKNSKAKCWYFVKNICHQRGTNVIDSTEFEMPAEAVNLNMDFSL